MRLFTAVVLSGQMMGVPEEGDDVHVVATAALEHCGDMVWHGGCIIIISAGDDELLCLFLASDVILLISLYSFSRIASDELTCAVLMKAVTLSDNMLSRLICWMWKNQSPVRTCV